MTLVIKLTVETEITTEDMIGQKGGLHYASMLMLQVSDGLARNIRCGKREKLTGTVERPSGGAIHYEITDQEE